MKQPWWKRSVVYQIYPKSFYDTSGNGVGDIKGITAKLDYLKELGIDVVWITPIYKSPQNDNGYDISDYFNIHEEYGTMEDFDELLEEAHSRGIKIIMDIVINHTSTENQWFIESRKSKDNEYRDFYIWKDGKEDGSEPTNWQSKFGGNAWQYDEETGQYYLHLFDVTQADLNWENDKVREKLYDMMHFWLKKGVDGFRLDVINLISKDQDFPDDDGTEPTNWQSKFGGNAWQYDEKTGQYYLHLFDVTQADLNWENDKVREKLYDMMHFWLKKGVDGFRLDVINLISKDQDFPDDDGSVAPGDGRKFYTDGPKVHDYMQEMNKEVFSQYDIMTVGEMSSTTIDHCIKYSNPERNELSMTFNFHHLKVDYPNGEKWSVADFDFLKLKDILSTWQREMNKGGGWNALFWCNHDQPRIVSRYGDDGEYRTESAKMLATTIHMMQGTPYIYQGEEFGMTNPKFTGIEEYRDVESLNTFNILKEQGKSEEEILEILRHKSRDNSRTPVQWNSDENAGFTSGTPWIPVAKNYQEINAEQALGDESSVFYHYQKLNRLRKEYGIIVDGDYQLILEDHPDIFAFVRNGDGERLLVVNNFYAHETEFTLPDEVDVDGWSSEVLISNYEDARNVYSHISLRPYESIVFRLTK